MILNLNLLELLISGYAHFPFSFALMQKKQKIKAICQPEFFAVCLNTLPN